MQKKIEQKISIIGAGAWGSALAIHLAKNSNPSFLQSIFLFSKSQKQIKEINSLHTNSKIFPGIKFPANIIASADFPSDCDFLFLVIPSKNLDEFFAELTAKKLKESCILVLCTKGIASDGKGLITDKIISILEKSGSTFKKLAKNLVILSGPNFAIEVAKNLPTITSIASDNKKAAQKVIDLLSGKNFLAIYLPDMRCAEICGAFKNVMAIGCGLVEGLKLGENCKAALVLRGIAEIQLLCKKLSASQDLTNAAGFGDIFLTCSSRKSRNFSLGLELAKKSASKINQLKSQIFSKVDLIEHKTCEGEIAAPLLVKLAKINQLHLPLCCAIAEILQKKFDKNQLKTILINAILT